MMISVSIHNKNSQETGVERATLHVMEGQGGLEELLSLRCGLCQEGPKEAKGWKAGRGSSLTVCARSPRGPSDTHTRPSH